MIGGFVDRYGYFLVLIYMISVGFGMGCGGVNSAATSSPAPPPSSTVSTYSIGGTISGLMGTVVLQDNDGDNLSVTADGDFTFVTTLIDATAYSVSVLTNPSGQICSASSNTGTVAGANVTSVVVTCSTNSNSYTLGGTVSGLGVGKSVILQVNGGDDLTTSADGSFQFATALADGTAYTVSVLTNPSVQTCVASSNTGTVTGANVTSVVVTCSTNSYTVGGTVSGLSGSIIMQDNSGDDLTINASGTFAFATSVTSGAVYSATVLTQPSTQTCTVTSGGGTMSETDITTVSVSCIGTKVILFSLTAPNGNLGGRSGADSACSNAASSQGLRCTTKAFISMSGADQISDMPTHYGVPTDLPIQSSNTTQIAATWSALLNATFSSLDSSLSGAGVIPSGQFWWSGSFSDGNNTEFSTCLEWSDGTSGQGGVRGDGDSTTGGWLYTNVVSCDGISAQYMLCICY